MRTDDLDLVRRMIAAHFRHAAKARTESKRQQHLTAVKAYTEAFPNLYSDGPARTHSGRRYQAAEAERGRNWNLPTEEQKHDFKI